MTSAPAAKPAPVLPKKLDEMVAQFVTLRDKIKAADDAHKEKTAAAREYKELLEAAMLGALNTAGGDSMKTSAGTVYKTTKRTAAIADPEAFRTFVIDNSAFELVDMRANSPAVDDFVTAHSAPPPGVNFSTRITVGVRRS